MSRTRDAKGGDKQCTQKFGRKTKRKLSLGRPKCNLSGMIIQKQRISTLTGFV